MKLTATQLRRIIAEEVSRLTETETVTVLPHGSSARMYITINPGPVEGTARLDFGKNYNITLKMADAVSLGQALTNYKYMDGFGVQVTPGDSEGPEQPVTMLGRKI
jgi:hypothetical protein